MTGGYRGLQGVTRDKKEFPGGKRGTGLQGVSIGYKESQEVTGG